MTCLGDGGGGFSCSDAGGDTGGTDSVALGFVNCDDAYLDAVFAERLQPNRVCLGDGNGGFTCSDVSQDFNEMGQVALGLVDDDAFLDAVFTGSGTSPLLCLGDGRGGFSCSEISGATGASYAVALGEFNPLIPSAVEVPGLSPAALTVLAILMALFGTSCLGRSRVIRR